MSGMMISDPPEPYEAEADLAATRAIARKHGAPTLEEAVRRLRETLQR